MTATPRRTCVGCRRVAPQDALIRVVRTPDGGLAVGRQLPGRGAWLCRDSADCIDLAARRQAFARALGAPLSANAVESLRLDARG